MNVSSVNSSAAAAMQAIIQQMLQEASETPAQTRAEAATGDPVAQRKLEYMADQQAMQAALLAGDARTPGSILNVKA